MDWVDNHNPTNKKMRIRCVNYVMIKETLYKRSLDGVLFRHVRPREAILIMAEMCEGIAGAHQSKKKMRWLIHKHGYY